MAKVEVPRGPRRDPDADRISIRARSKPPPAKKGIIIRPWRGRLIAQKAPKGHKRPRSGKEEANRLWFTYAAQAWKCLPWQIKARYMEQGRNPWLQPRDVFTAELASRLFSLSLPDGRVLYPIKAERDMSQSLDVFSQNIGAMLVRGRDRWQSLEPGAPGNVLTAHGPGEIVSWEEPSGGPGGGVGAFGCAVSLAEQHNFVNWWIIEWTQELYDDASLFDPANPTRITFPANGFAMATAYIGFNAAGGSGRWYAYLRLNGSTIGYHRAICPDFNVGPRVVLPSAIKVSAGDYLEAGLYNGSGSGKIAGTFNTLRVIFFQS